MYKNTPNLGTHEVDKSNYLKIGSILRLTKIDELPQLINFIKGELLLIGPRPGLNTQLKLKDETGDVVEVERRNEVVVPPAVKSKKKKGKKKKYFFDVF